MDNVYLIPHKAGPTFDLRGYIGHCLTEDAVRFIKGESLKYGIDRQSAERMTRHG
jgi:phosphoglycerate dehydrogenase-like enzyme